VAIVKRQLFTGPEAWLGKDVQNSDHWKFSLNDAEISEIDASLTSFKALQIDWRDMQAGNFPLPGLRATLDKVAEELENGSGMARVTGLPSKKYSEPDLRAVWFALGLHIGNPLYQDCNGLLMRDIEDRQEDTDTLQGHHLTTKQDETFISSKARTLSNGTLRFHTDRCDVVALLCVNPAREGGVSKIASSVTVRNLIVERHPELADVLYQPIPRSRLGEEKGGEDMHYLLPVFGEREGKFTSHYSKTYIEAAHEMRSAPDISDQQWQAIEMLHEVAEEVCMQMTMAAGDIQFLNNHIIYHARTEFHDTPADPGRQLHRLWLAMPNSRSLPKDQSVLWRKTEAGSLRGGIGQS